MCDQDALEAVKTLCEKATPMESITIHRYDHGGGRLFTEQPRTLVADFYHEADREFYIAARIIIPQLLAEVERYQWQPIETAPKDGTEILVTDGQAVAVGWWEDELDDEESGRYLPGEWITLAATTDLTAWMSLPTPPVMPSGGSHAK